MYLSFTNIAAILADNHIDILMCIDIDIFVNCNWVHNRWQYRGADKYLARPGSKKATATEDFDFHITYL